MHAVVAVAVVAAALIAWRLATCSDARSARPISSRTTSVSMTTTGRPPRRLDVAAYTADVERRRQRARTLASARAEREPVDGTRKVARDLVQLIEPQCYLGSRDVCDELRPLVEDCSAGDGPTCLAVAELVGDSPPRMLLAVSFFYDACKHGVAEGCARLERARARELKGSCEDDPFACAFIAARSQDRALLEASCALGAGESCTMLAARVEDPLRSRDLAIQGCQLGNPIGCWALGVALAPGCVPQRDQPCFPADADESRRALDMACAAGWGEGCAGHVD